MSTYFHDWRRTAGWGMLVTALGFSGLWALSYRYRNEFLVSTFSEFRALEIAAGTFRWERLSPGSVVDIPFQWNCRIIKERMIQPFFGMKIEWYFEFAGFQFGAASYEGPWVTRVEIWIVPFYSVIVPLSLLSAHLLLSKPRNTCQTPSPERISN